MAKQVSFSLPAFSLKRSLRALIPLMAILCFTLETFTPAFPVYADGQSVRVGLLDADRFASIRLTENSSECLELQTTYNLVDHSPWWWINVRPNTTITPIVYRDPGCRGTSRRTNPSSVNVGTVEATLRVQICNEEGQPTSLPDFTPLEEGMCFAYHGSIFANGVKYPASAGGVGPQ